MAELYKHSHNIIDLIEVGDYVNGNYVWRDDYGFYFPEGTMLVGGLEQGNFLNEVAIKSIVTKQQFESMSYKVGE